MTYCCDQTLPVNRNAATTRNATCASLGGVGDINVNQAIAAHATTNATR